MDGIGERGARYCFLRFPDRGAGHDAYFYLNLETAVVNGE
jgi:hypothetical protein